MFKKIFYMECGTVQTSGVSKDPELEKRFLKSTRRSLFFNLIHMNVSQKNTREKK